MGSSGLRFMNGITPPYPASYSNKNRTRASKTGRTTPFNCENELNKGGPFSSGSVSG